MSTERSKAIHALAKPISRRRALAAAGVVGGGLALAKMGAQTASAQTPPVAPQSIAELTRVAPDVYMFRSIGHNALIITSDEGTLIVDPAGLSNPRGPIILAGMAASLSNGPVRYMVYSHDHADHNTGGRVFTSTATFVSQRLAAPKIAARNDANSPVPTLLVDDFMALDLGGKRIELHYAGVNHSDNSLVVLYPDRRLAFAVDIVPVRTLPFLGNPDFNLQAWIDSLAWIDTNLDFDTLVPGHGPIGTKTWVSANIRIFNDGIRAVNDARRAGLEDGSPAMIARVRADLFGTYGAFDDFEARITSFTTAIAQRTRA